MSEENNDKERLFSFLSDKLSDENGEIYINSKKLSKKTPLSSKQIGVFLGRHDDGEWGIEVEKWGRSKNTTWYIQET